MPHATHHTTLTPTRIERALRLHGTTRAAAQALGVSDKTLRKHCRQYGITYAPQPRYAGQASLKAYRAASMDLDALSSYLNRCATPGCDGAPLVDGYCVRCAARRSGIVGLRV